MAMDLRLHILMDNHTEIDVYYLGEPAVSYWLEVDGKNFLFDTGYSDAFLQNADAMGLDVTQAEAILLSHSHNDHTGGLRPLLARDVPPTMRLIVHPDALLPHAYQGMDIGSPVSQEELAKRLRLTLTKEPVWLTERLLWLGEIPRTLDFEPPYAIGTVERGGAQTADYIPDDTALVYIGREGLSIITGCSHAGICNIIAYAKKLTGEGRIRSVLGGFHLFEMDERARATIDFLRQEHIPELYPCHCTSFAVRAALHQACPVTEVAVGTVLEWE